MRFLEKKDSCLGEVYLSKEISVCLKGLFAITVLLHHLYQHAHEQIGILSNIIVSGILQFSGAWSVSMFFFFSGYGLMSSYKMKGRIYVLELPKKRILPFYLICIFLIAVYSAVKILTGVNITLGAVIDSLLRYTKNRIQISL